MKLESLRDYLEFTRTTAAYPDARKTEDKGPYGDNELVYTAGALRYVISAIAEEAGEVAGAYAKAVRKDGKVGEFKKKVSKELGDLFYQWTRLCDELGLDPNQVILENYYKLTDRKNRGVIIGEGDER